MKYNGYVVFIHFNILRIVLQNEKFGYLIKDET